MKHQRRQSDMGGLLALVLFGVFAVCILSVLLTGAGAYKRLTQAQQADYDSRTAAQYLATKVRQADCAEQVAAGSFAQRTGSGDTLHLREEIGETAYVTRIYCCDGFLRELFAEEGGSYEPEDGEKILEAESVSFACEDGVLTVQLSQPDGRQANLTLYLRSGEAVTP